MSNVDEKIKAYFSKEVKSKTILVSKDQLKTIIDEHVNDGWELQNQVELNGKIKVTFIKVK